jgi:hypothetical protein
MSLKYNVNTEIQYTKNNYYEKPEGWVIMDSWNNPFFPIQNTKNIMTSEFNLPELRKIFHMEYNGRPEDLFLPWHYTIDIINMTPYIIQTRPFNYKTYIPNYEKKIFIVLFGDSNVDIYPETLYKTIAHAIINPFKAMRGTFFMQNTRQDFEFFTGNNFKIDTLFRYFI